MSDWLVGAALLSALLHAAWNAGVKASANPTQAMAGQMFVAGLLALPGLGFSGWPAAAAWPWLAASTLLNVAAVVVLLRAYELAAFECMSLPSEQAATTCTTRQVAWLRSAGGPGGRGAVTMLCRGTTAAVRLRW